MPRRNAAVIAGLIVVALLVVFAWRQSRQNAADAAARRADMQPVIAAVDAAAANSAQCAERFSKLTDPAASLEESAVDGLMAETEDCGFMARALAEEGYARLDSSASAEDSEAKANFLDAAGATLSVYELQGDDFDALHDLLESNGPIGSGDVREEARRLLTAADGDIADATRHFRNNQDAYAAGK
ncbi:hypothetical protein D6850_05800 [Roseovarius spongiae]|uniref:Uncharacterized protein n=1 Tax=Roseovarius spongiae TaxID=2320272 RepID=A0A3A8BBZ5_9RHOB|nr:hypothetical protein [Roseovarius spongiae]RKF17032.1 hypothetical protein D6850_05800 [Roseovarius spongiae]